MLGGRNDGWIGRCNQAPRADCPTERQIGRRLVERHAPGIDGIDRFSTDVVADHAGAPPGEGDRKRQSYVTAASDNHHIARETIVPSPSGHEGSP